MGGVQKTILFSLFYTCTTDKIITNFTENSFLAFFETLALQLPRATVDDKSE